ncbi:MAG: aldo/keto reductase [Candidatus Krumholzibacteriia bacterium]
MEYRNFGRTGMKVSQFALGCMNFGGRSGEEESLAVIERALEWGINLLDTANVYSQGASEEIVGKALKASGRRERIIVATKVHGRTDHKDPNAQGNHRRHIVAECEKSLRRLGTDTIDLYQIHRPCADIPIDETLRALDDLIKSGKVRYIGTSTFASWQIMESLWVSKELGLNRFVAEQPPYHLLDRRAERELLPMAITYGLAVLPWSPLAGGMLTGKYRRGEAAPDGARFRRKNDKDLNFSDAAMDVVDLVCEMAKEKECTPGQLALAWCAGQDGVTCPIIGPRTLEQLEDNLGAGDVTLTDDDRLRIDAVAAPGRAIVPYYFADFGPHWFRW